MNVFDTLINVTMHEFAVMCLITTLGMFGNMCYTIAVR